MGDKKVRLKPKLLVNTKANKVLFAETSKDCVDFLFHILSLPIGTAIKLVSTKGMVGSLGDLYKSVATLSSDYLLPDFNVNSLLKPSSTGSNAPDFCLFKDSPTENCTTGKSFYGYSSCNEYVSDSPTAVCPACSQTMSTEKTFIAFKVSSSSMNVTTSGNVGYVKGVVTYMIMDNLEVKPNSTISGITMMNQFNVKDVSSLAEKQVQFGLDQGIVLLKALFETQAVLTAVFLAKALVVILSVKLVFWGIING